MKTSLILFRVLIPLGFGLLISSCVKDEEGYSEFIQNYLDSITAINEIPVDLDLPCEPIENGLDFYTIDYDLTETSCDDNGNNGFDVIAENQAEDLLMVLTFKSKPVPGEIYNTEYDFGDAPTSENGVIVHLYFDDESYDANHSDLIYVEKIPGNIFVFSFCELRLIEDFDEVECEGSFNAIISECD